MDRTPYIISTRIKNESRKTTSTEEVEYIGTDLAGRDDNFYYTVKDVVDQRKLRLRHFNAGRVAELRGKNAEGDDLLATVMLKVVSK